MLLCGARSWDGTTKADCPADAVGKPEVQGGRDAKVRGGGVAAEAGSGTDQGRAILEVVFLAALLMIPVIYLLLFALRIQASTLAVTEAAREAGRSIQTASSLSQGLERAERAVRVALADQSISAERMTMYFVDGDRSCGAAPVTPDLAPGTSYLFCVRVTVALPGIPDVLTGKDNTVTGAYLIHIDEVHEGG